MKHSNKYAGVSMMALMFFMAGCGGGGDDEAGSPAGFAVVPNTFTLTAATTANGGPPAGQCISGNAGIYYVYGGAAPYRLDNTMPDAVKLDKTTVSEPGGGFSVALDGSQGCVTNATVVITDKLNNRVLLTLNNKPAS